MRAPTHGNHPCPILKPEGGDYINGASFSTEVPDAVTDPNDPTILHYYVKPVLHCPTIQAWIDDKKAKMVVIYEQFTVRKSVPVINGVADVVVKQHQLALGKNIEITPLVVAANSFMFSYNSDAMDHLIALFSDDTFVVDKGQILAYGQCREIETTEPAGLSSIILITLLDKSEKVPFKVVLSGQQIEVQIPESIKRSLNVIQGSALYDEGLANTALAYPVFAYAIQAMCSDPEAYQDKDWFAALKNKLSQLEFTKNGGKGFDPNPSLAKNPEDVWRLTQELLDDLMVTSFEKCGGR